MPSRAGPDVDGLFLAPRLAQAGLSRGCAPSGADDGKAAGAAAGAR